MVEPKKKLNKEKKRKGNDREILRTSKMLKNWRHGYENNTVRVKGYFYVSLNLTGIL